MSGGSESRLEGAWPTLAAHSNWITAAISSLSLILISFTAESLELWAFIIITYGIGWELDAGEII